MTKPIPDLEPAALEAKLKLWFFRDIQDEHRLALYRLCGLPVEELTTHGAQQKAFAHLLAARSTAPEAVATVHVFESATCNGREMGRIRDWDNFVKSLPVGEHPLYAALASSHSPELPGPTGTTDSDLPPDRVAHGQGGRAGEPPTPSGGDPVAWRRDRDGHLIDQQRQGYAPLYAAPQAVPAEDIACLVADLRKRAEGIEWSPDANAFRNAAATLTSLSARLAEAERQADLRLDRYLTALKRAETAERKLEEHRKALAHLIASWEAIPGDQQHSARVIDRWLSRNMKPAIDRARALSGTSE